jgi:hypothetical protein
MKPVQHPAFPLYASSTSSSSPSDTPQKELFDAITAGDAQTIKALCDTYPINLGVSDQYGNTPIHLAIRTGQHSIASFLLDAAGTRDRSFLSATDHSGATPLMLATYVRDIALMKRLVELGTDDGAGEQILAQDEQQAASLIPAMILLEARGDLSIAFELAVDYRIVEAATIYFEAGASTVSPLRGDSATLAWLSDHYLIQISDVFVVLDEATSAHDAQTITLLTSPEFVLHTLTTLDVPTDKLILEALHRFILAGINPEILLSALVEQLTSYDSIELQKAQTSDFDLLRLLISIGTPCTDETVKLVKSGEFKNLWIVTRMIDYGADAVAALKALRPTSEHWGNSIARCALEHVLRHSTLSENEKILRLQGIILEDNQDEAINVAVRTLLNDGPLDHVKLLIQAGMPHNAMLLVALSDRARAFHDETIRVRAALPLEQQLTQQYVRQHIHLDPDLLISAKMLCADAESFSLRNGYIVEIQQCRSTAKIIMNTALEVLMQKEHLSIAEKSETLKIWMQDEMSRLGLSELLFDILAAGHKVTAKLMVVAGVPATDAFVTLSQELLRRNAHAKTYTAQLVRLGADFRPAMRQIMANIQAYAHRGDCHRAENEQNALYLLSQYVATELRHLR